MQSIEQIEHICCQNELDRAEVYWNAQDEEPTAQECYEDCIHAGACTRMLAILQGYEEREAKEANELGDVARMFQCDTCDEHEDAWRLMSLSGTMR